MNAIKALALHLLENRSSIVREVTVVTEHWSPTFGGSSSSETIDVIDFDSLIREIDEFSMVFRDDGAEKVK